MATQTTILVLGGAGFQNTNVVKELVKNKLFSVKLMSRNINTPDCQALASLSGVALIEGDCYNETDLVSAFTGVDACYVNTNGFAIGEKSEIYWGIRIYEIAYWAGVEHFVYSALPYVSKKSGFNPESRVPFTDAKGKVADYLRSQPADKMNWSILESGPYADSHLASAWVPSPDEDGVYVFRMPFGQGAKAYVSIADLAWFARHIFEDPAEFKGDLLSVGIEHASGEDVAKAFTAVTGKPARFEPLDIHAVATTWTEQKIGHAGSPGYDDPTLMTQAQQFVPWFTLWSQSRGNKGLWTRDYARLDRIYPERNRTIEQWMRSVNYTGEPLPYPLKYGLGLD